MNHSTHKIWLSGATGFLGSHVARLLADTATVLTSRTGGQVDGRIVQSVDILDAEAVQRSAAGCSAALICAGMVSRDKDAAARLHRLHVDGTRSALLGLKAAGVKRVVLASTSGTIAVGTDAQQIMDEDSPSPMQYIASWPYYRSKYYGEQLALSFQDDSFEVVVANPSLLLGPGDLRESSTSDVRKFLERAIVAIPSGGIAFVDVRDAAQGLLLCLEKGRAGERYILNGSNMTLRTFFSRLSRISGVAAPSFGLPKNKALSGAIFGLYDRTIRAMGGVVPVDAESVEMGQYYWYCSSAKAERLFGFTARDPGETLRDTVIDLVERKVVAPLPLSLG